MSSMVNMSAAQAAQQSNRTGDGRYTEKRHADPGSQVVPRNEKHQLASAEPNVRDFGHGQLWISLRQMEGEADLAAARAHDEYEARKSEWTRLHLAEEIVTAELPPGSVIRLTECHHFDNNPNNDPRRTWVSIDEVYYSAEDYLAGTTAGNPDYRTDMAYEVILEEFWDDYKPTSTVVDFDQFTMDGHPDLVEVDKVLGWLREQVQPDQPPAS